MPASTFLGSGSSSSPPFSVPGQSDVGPPVFPEVAPHQLAPDTETTTLHALVRTLSDQSNAKFSTDSASGPTRYVKLEFAGGVPKANLKASILLSPHFPSLHFLDPLTLTTSLLDSSHPDHLTS